MLLKVQSPDQQQQQHPMKLVRNGHYQTASPARNAGVRQQSAFCTFWVILTQSQVCKALASSSNSRGPAAYPASSADDPGCFQRPPGAPGSSPGSPPGRWEPAHVDKECHDSITENMPPAGSTDSGQKSPSHHRSSADPSPGMPLLLKDTHVPLPFSEPSPAVFPSVPKLWNEKPLIIVHIFVSHPDFLVQVTSPCFLYIPASYVRHTGCY